LAGCHVEDPLEVFAQAVLPNVVRHTDDHEVLAPHEEFFAHSASVREVLVGHLLADHQYWLGLA